jgi:hypothetical protein
MIAKLQRVGKVPGHLEHVRQRVNKIVDLHNAAPTGALIGDDKTIVVKKLPDGRYQLSLHPSIISQFV